MDHAAYPEVTWGHERVAFEPAAEAGSEGAAALVFAFYGDRLVLADIAGRGWCIPSGRREPAETLEETARREAREEVGATLGRLLSLGRFVFRRADGGVVRTAHAFVAEVVGLEPIPPSSESLGRILVPTEEVAALYYVWDALLDAVFSQAEAMRTRLLRPGIALSDWTGEE